MDPRGPHWRCLLLVTIVAPGCSAAALNGFASGLAAAQNGQVAAADNTRLMLFGGENHRTYLGCLNCNQFDSESVLNEFGSYGSAYSSTSIFNHYDDFGSKYSIYGACNLYASDPPVIVDGQGQFYGRLTVNRFNPQRTRDARLLGWLAAVCE